MVGSKHVDDVLRSGTAAEAEELRALLRDVVVHADRLRDGWAEGDEAVRKRLWANLHTAAEAAYEQVYPL